MNLKDIRNALFYQSDWAPTQSADAITRVNAFINRAYLQLAEEAPFLFFEDQQTIVTLPDSKRIDSQPADLIRVDTEPWVMRREITTVVVLAGGGTLWDVTGRWDSRMVEITAPDGTVYRRRVRELWTGEDNLQRFTLMRPWPNITDTGMEYRFYNSFYPLPDDVIEVSSVRITKKNQNWPLDIVGQLEAEKYSLADAPSQVAAGVPRTAFRREHFSIAAPTLTPVVTATGSEWQGPEPGGKFSYYYTYIWGNRDDAVANPGPEGSIIAPPTSSFKEPRFESAPSPISTTVDTNQGAGRTTDPAAASFSNPHEEILIQFSDPDYIQGYGRIGTVRIGRSGWRVRLYRRRHSVDPDYASLPNRDSPQALGAEHTDAYFLLAEISDLTRGFGDTGTYLPDYHRRLRETHGYATLALYPRPDRRYEMDVRCTRRPLPLRDDSDTPLIHRDAMEVLVQKALAMLYEAQGNPALADRSLSRFREALFTMTKRYGDLRYPAEPVFKKPGRASRITATQRPWRRWYNLPD